ncbi:COMM domain containing 2 (predicted), isoform CRA_a [Rattus norvegicus]|uniref:COMM domain containing 2 (Predicted), isoform CRA_a n=1 Tax=Rattus norvegicus TaxID=10116 RepID=A6JVG9_RAT|nr:COMM domain containing 2 (predicted), isoform CRA_a [Rattus norvegicus]
MLLDLSEEHKEHLAFLPQVDSAVVAEFGRIAVEFLRRGSNPKIYEGAASKKGRGQALSVELESAIYSLSPQEPLQVLGSYSSCSLLKARRAVSHGANFASSCVILKLV